MSRSGRLLGLHMQGFKSFAERTHVEFVAGINAVVGPNGSGKSNLADALRWALGEQGRAIRSRKSEDVVFAGSEKRSALGMADVALVLDNADGLVPVDFAQLELGRRLYRSGENDYLVNRQRVRLRDLVDLLDGAHLADNAFLFIGQGMVDQALALRPEERRPLFEEVAGVRRHERRRRRADEQLGEAQANLARVEDILGELRPQARRLAAQAEQQVSRARAGQELAAGLVASLGTRWHAAAQAAASADAAMVAARRDAAAALERLQEAENRAADAARELAARSAAELERRGVLEAARATRTEIDLQSARASAETAALRTRPRAPGERARVGRGGAGDAATRARPAGARPRPCHRRADPRDRGELADARGEAHDLRAATTARSDAETALRRAAAGRAAELEGARRRLADLDRTLAEAQSAAHAAAEQAAAAGAAAARATSAAATARSAEAAASGAREASRAAASALEAERMAVLEEAGTLRARAAAIRGRHEALVARLAEDETRGIGRAARRLGGRAVAADLDVDPSLRIAVAAALGDLARSFVIRRESLAALADERGVVVLGDAAGPGSAPPAPAEVAVVRERAARYAGGLLVDAVRTDREGVARRLLARAAWVPALADAVELAAMLPPGWRVAARNGSLVTSAGTATLGLADATLERQAEIEALARDLAVATAARDATGGRLAAVEAAAAAAGAALEMARQRESEAAGQLRAAEGAERRAERDAEQHAREAGWHASRAQAAGAERALLADRLGALEAAAAEADATLGRAQAGHAPDVAGALAALEARTASLHARIDRLSAERAAREADRRAVEARRARAEAALALSDERIARVDAEAAGVEGRLAELESGSEARERALAHAAAREAAALDALEAVRHADAADRQDLGAAEAATAASRDALRRSEEAHRSSEVHDLEARLGLDAVREQALVELAGLGLVGLRALEAVAAAHVPGGPPPGGSAEVPGVAPSGSGGSAGGAALAGPAPTATATSGGDEDEEGAALAAALAAAGAAWSERLPDGEAAPPARLAALRRRFHELGASNPFAADEYTVVKARLEDLEAQRTDLLRAIEKTRSLIGELDALIASQFRTTFQALEAAFERRFQQLFGGGFARLSLTDPADLTATGVDIVARPPGKKAQALAMLSGGERALTAVALLFAMLEVRPVPFCVLDEVDAALDEANVGRFVEALRGLAAQTQFIVITHNRGTIEAADALFGVTVGEDAVSRVISLRIEEATAIADRALGARVAAGRLAGGADQG